MEERLLSGISTYIDYNIYSVKKFESLIKNKHSFILYYNKLWFEATALNQC